LYVLGNSTVNNNKGVNAANKPAEALAVAGGGGITILVGSVHIDNHSQVRGNKTQGMYSGGIVSFLGDVCVSNHSSISENENRGPGGGIACNFNSSVTIDQQSNVRRNQGSSLGGGIVNFSSGLGNVTVTGESLVEHNSLTDAQTIEETVAIFLIIFLEYLDNITEQATLPGSGLNTGGQKLVARFSELSQLAQGTLTQLQSVLATLKTHAATSGPRTIAGCGVATLLSCATSLLKDSLVSENEYAAQAATTVIGGGVATLSGPLSMYDARVFSNKAGFGGGAFCGASSVNVSSSELWHNTATAGAGGGLYLQDSNALLAKAKVVENRASSEADAGIYKTENSEVILLHSKIQH
jgi:hypothetical protein